MVAENHIGGILAAALCALIDDIIMEEGGRVNKLHARREACGALHIALVKRRRRERQERPHALPARRDQIARQLRDHRDAGLHMLQDQRIDAAHIAVQLRG